MSITFDRFTWPHTSNRKKFGLCDESSPSTKPAYLDDFNGIDWIAVVENEDQTTVYFTGIDHQITLLKDEGTMDSRCDGVLGYDDTITFVELKQRAARGSGWVKDGEAQLRSTIAHFEKSDEAENYTVKRAYIANSEHPKFKETQITRMERFLTETGYVLRVENRIKL